ncbi:histone-lysine N-methyltransferase SETMAR [Trichonephila clavipes]|uniref:Histone-lysine N-methyltransferase SETMAR n=1 Tax=Trichonephila clavipes TaxID=2585209 RepID=A0A8X6SKW7_TRICX|nr:histone-lysine N-methyltransferase SETMAR [Trichonephila clavipes]
MVFKATANDMHHLVLCHDEFRGPRFGLCRSGGTTTPCAALYMIVKLKCNIRVEIHLYGPFSCELQGVKNGSQQRENLVLFSLSLIKAKMQARPAVENVDKITEVIEVDRHVSSRSIAQGLKIIHKTVLSHLCNVEFKEKLHLWVPHQLTHKNMMDRISNCEALVKWNEIDPFLKRMVTGGEKWVTYYNIVRKRSWSKCCEAAQTVAKSELTVMKVLLYIL